MGDFRGTIVAFNPPYYKVSSFRVSHRHPEH
jgi:hypothetical protein